MDVEVFGGSQVKTRPQQTVVLGPALLAGRLGKKMIDHVRILICGDGECFSALVDIYRCFGEVFGKAKDSTTRRRNRVKRVLTTSY